MAPNSVWYMCYQVSRDKEGTVELEGSQEARANAERLIKELIDGECLPTQCQTLNPVN